jgi:hypothetical protein
VTRRCPSRRCCSRAGKESGNDEDGLGREGTARPKRGDYDGGAQPRPRHGDAPLPPEARRGRRGALALSPGRERGRDPRGRARSHPRGRCEAEGARQETAQQPAAVEVGPRPCAREARRLDARRRPVPVDARLGRRLRVHAPRPARPSGPASEGRTGDGREPEVPSARSTTTSPHAKRTAMRGWTGSPAAQGAPPADEPLIARPMEPASTARHGIRRRLERRSSRSTRQNPSMGAYRPSMLPRAPRRLVSPGPPPTAPDASRDLGQIVLAIAQALFAGVVAYYAWRADTAQIEPAFDAEVSIGPRGEGREACVTSPRARPPRACGRGRSRRRSSPRCGWPAPRGR